jgi:hypothetical protein
MEGGLTVEVTGRRSVQRGANQQAQLVGGLVDRVVRPKHDVQMTNALWRHAATCSVIPPQKRSVRMFTGGLNAGT